LFRSVAAVDCLVVDPFVNDALRFDARYEFDLMLVRWCRIASLASLPDLLVHFPPHAVVRCIYRVCTSPLHSSAAADSAAATGHIEREDETRRAGQTCGV
jgi:hypothetical protein